MSESGESGQLVGAGEGVREADWTGERVICRGVGGKGLDAVSRLGRGVAGFSATLERVD